MNLYSLWRLVNDEWELVRLSTHREELRNLMSEDAKGCLLPLQYKLTIERVSGDLTKDGRISAFRQAGKLFDMLAKGYRTGGDSHSAYRCASCKMFALMEQEIGK